MGLARPDRAGLAPPPSALPTGRNGLWILTPLRTLPLDMSSVNTTVQPASAAVATSSASQYEARPASASARAARTAAGEVVTVKNNSSQSAACVAASAGGVIPFRVAAT